MNLQARLAESSDGWSYYPRDPLAQRVHHALASLVLKDPPVVSGAAHLDAIRGKGVVIVANHLLVSDANVIEVLLQQSGGSEVAERLSVVAGPKVYSDLSRRFSSLCFGTIKSPQNEGVSSGDASMTAREVATAARQTIQTAEERLRRRRCPCWFFQKAPAAAREKCSAFFRCLAILRIGGPLDAAYWYLRHRAHVRDRRAEIRSGEHHDDIGRASRCNRFAP